MRILIFAFIGNCCVIVVIKYLHPYQQNVFYSFYFSTTDASMLCTKVRNTNFWTKIPRSQIQDPQISKLYVTTLMHTAINHIVGSINRVSAILLYFLEGRDGVNDDYISA